MPIIGIGAVTLKVHVAGQGAVDGVHGYCSSGRASRHNGFDLGTGDNPEFGGRFVESDAASAGQIASEDMTVAPTSPDVGTIFTTGPRPAASLKISSFCSTSDG
jgi:hypothetical protein